MIGDDDLKENLIKLTKELLSFSAIVFSMIMIRILTGISCPIWYLFGVPCCGCGMTRATMALLRFDFIRALSFHPLVFFMPIFLILYIYCRLKNINTNNLIYCICISFLVTYIIRMFFIENDPVMYINIKSGMIYKLYHFLLEGGKKLW